MSELDEDLLPEKLQYPDVATPNVQLWMVYGLILYIIHLGVDLVYGISLWQFIKGYMLNT
jgi:hypothetical protein